MQQVRAATNTPTPTQSKVTSSEVDHQPMVSRHMCSDTRPHTTLVNGRPRCVVNMGRSFPHRCDAASLPHRISYVSSKSKVIGSATEVKNRPQEVSEIPYIVCLSYRPPPADHRLPHSRCNGFGFLLQPHQSDCMTPFHCICEWLRHEVCCVMCS